MSAASAGPGARAALAALTPEARAALGGPEIEIGAFPFRVGRESRKMKWTEHGIVAERRDPESRPNNDLYLVEVDEVMHLSREHFQIGRETEGYVLEDRRSTCGTIVEGEVVGGQHAGGRIPLRDGDVIIAGTAHSPWIFKFKAR